MQEEYLANMYGVNSSKVAPAHGLRHSRVRGVQCLVLSCYHATTMTQKMKVQVERTCIQTHVIAVEERGLVLFQTFTRLQCGY